MTPATFTSGTWFAQTEALEDPDRQRLDATGREQGHDQLIERQREGQEGASEQRRAEGRERHPPERLP